MYLFIVVYKCVLCCLQVCILLFTSVFLLFTCLLLLFLLFRVVQKNLVFVVGLSKRLADIEVSYLLRLQIRLQT